MLLIAITLLASRAGAQAITTVAGNGAAGYSGDNASATLAQLNHPFSVAADALGNYYIADRANNRIRKVAAGIITTIAGTGSAGFGGDNGPATAAAISDPTGLAVDNTGNIYIADRGNNRIRKIDATGTITTIAGNGNAAFSGDNGPAVQAELNQPRGVAVDANGNVYIADQTNHRVRKISAGVISTIAGNGIQGFSGDGNPATLSQLNNPAGICADADGNIYIADVGNERVRKIDITGTISTIAGNGSIVYNGDNGPATQAALNEPLNLAADIYGNIFIAEGYNHRIRRVNSSGIITTVAGTGTAGYTGDGGPASLADLDRPYGLALGLAGDLYIADYNNNAIRLVTNPTALATAKNRQCGLSLWPNPNNGSFSLQVQSDAYPLRLALYNAFGLQAADIQINDERPVVLHLQLPSGLYFLASGGTPLCTQLVIRNCK
jgi:sugar lactone lactonase YvrE